MVAKTVAMTILEASVNPRKLVYLNEFQFQKIRNSTNESIRDMSSTWITLCDTAKDFPQQNLSASKMIELWTIDKVHPTAKGYDRLGEVIFNCIYDQLRY